MTRPGLFVTGTDTGVGKTLVACAILRALRARGIDLGALKPVETGVDGDRPADALALQAAAGGEDSLEELSLLNNLRPDDLVAAGKLLKIVEPPLESRADSDPQ